MFAISFSWAQLAQPAAPDAATLAKYDKNKNGQLDAAELAAMEADQATAARTASAAVTTAPSTDVSGEVIELSPFEVVTDTRGYYSANTMSGTRFNTKVEDLASSLSVVTKEQMTDFAMLDTR